MARTLARDLARVGLTVVSGLARGVDAAAHQGALDGGGRTIAVLGSGLDWVYPPEHRPLSRAISATGAVITELPPGAAPLPGHFPLRNRIISGLSRAVVVVEAAERSGALITASVALSQGREVLAVPGGVAGGRHKGCHGLIKDGARVVESVEDILEEISWPVASPPPAGQAANRNEISSLVRLIPKGVPVGLDRLVEATGRSAPELLAELSVLEIDGVVGRTTGPAWVRLD